MTGPAVAPEPPADELRRRALRGGWQLLLRGASSLVVGLIGSLLLVSLMGPRAFGVYAGALAIASVVVMLATCGVDVALLRGPHGRGERSSDRAFATLLVTSTVIAGLGLLLTVPLAATRYGPFVDVLRALLLLVPVNVLWVPAQTRLERDLRFGPLAAVEVGGSVVLYLTACAAAAAGLGAWAGVVGYACWQASQLGVVHVVARYRPRPVLDLAWSASVLRWGAAYTASQWLWRSRELVNPVVVGGLLGPAAVGQVALAVRLVDNASFVRRAAWRLSVVVLDRLRDDRQRFARAVEASSRAQVLLVGSALAGVGAAVPLVLVPLLGPEWDAVGELVPLVAAAALLNAALAPCASTLYVLGRTSAVARFHAAYVLLALGGALWLVPRAGVQGLALGELLATGAYAVLLRDTRARVPVRLRLEAALLTALLPLLLLTTAPPLLAPVLVLPAALVLSRRSVRSRLRQDTVELLDALRPPAPVPTEA